MHAYALCTNNLSCGSLTIQILLPMALCLLCTLSFLHASHLISGLLLYLLFPHQMTPLHLAAESGQVKSLNFLVEKGADINNQDDNGVIIYHTNAGRLVD